MPDDDEPLVFDLESRAPGIDGGRARRVRPRTVVAAAGAVGAMIAVPLLWSTDDGSSVGSDASAAQGGELFQAHGCSRCHSLGANQDNFGPPLGDARSWAGERRPGLSASEYLEESIRNPAAFFSPAAYPGGGAMPHLNVSDAEIEALVAFLLER